MIVRIFFRQLAAMTVEAGGADTQHNSGKRKKAGIRTVRHSLAIPLIETKGKNFEPKASPGGRLGAQIKILMSVRETVAREVQSRSSLRKAVAIFNGSSIIRREHKVNHHTSDHHLALPGRGLGIGPNSGRDSWRAGSTRPFSNPCRPGATAGDPSNRFWQLSGTNRPLHLWRSMV